MTNKVREYFIEKIMNLTYANEFDASQLLDEILQWCIDSIEQLKDEVKANLYHV
jgi:hypothetical protein